jgi:hypothetical protein
MRLKINESKTLEFEMDTSGCSWKELDGYFRLTLENVEYGFPAKVEEGMIKIDIPVFSDILNEGVKSSLYKHREVTVKARLDLIANNEAYVSPWQGEIDIEIPVSVKITEEKVLDKATESDKKVKVVDPDIKEYLEEERKRKKKSKLMDAFQKPEVDKEEKIEEDVKEKVDEKVDEKKKIKDKETRTVKKSRFSVMLEEPEGK